jgi:ComF family protein
VSLAVRFIDSILELLSPSQCAACGAPCRAVFCSACGRPKPVSSRHVDGVPVVSAGSYEPPLDAAIRRFKFERHPELARPLAGLLDARVKALGVGPSDAWVPVPLHRARLVERGFNQSALVARCLARSTRSVFAARALERLRDTEQQARLGRSARSDNALGAFALRRAAGAGRVVLVDDVVTTGATASACLAALREGGIAVLAIVALAQAPARGLPVIGTSRSRSA